MNPQEVATAIKGQLSSLDVEVYDYVPDGIIPPCIAIYTDDFPYNPNEWTTFILWCIAGAVDMQDAQARLSGWLSDDSEDSVIALLDADPTLGGVVSSIIPVNVRHWGVSPTGEGRPRFVQAELVCQVLR